VILYHYCSNSTFLSIISGRNIRASEFSLSNDHLEGKWSRRLLDEFCAERQMFPMMQTILLEEFDRCLLQYFFAVGFCLSEDGDLLSQWRGYADDGRGVAIGFESSFFTDLMEATPDRSKGFNLLFVQVCYDQKEQRNTTRPYFEKFCELTNAGALTSPSFLSDKTEEEHQKNARLLQLEMISFIPHLYALKNPAFREEKEWRLLTLITPGNALAVTTSEQPSGWKLFDMDYHAKPDRLVPFRSFGLAKTGFQPIREVVIGPKNITPESFVDGALRRYGVVAQVRRSTASYR
jgi:hypothetical protein